MFKFRLDPLITFRDNVLKERQAELAKAHEARRILEEDRQGIDRQLADGIVAARSAIQEGQTVDVNALLGFRRQEIFLRADRDRLTQMMGEIDKEIEKLLAAVVEANKELKIVEKLKEKQYEKYLSEESKTEMKIMDELAGNRHKGNNSL